MITRRKTKQPRALWTTIPSFAARGIKTSHAPTQARSDTPRKWLRVVSKSKAGQKRLYKQEAHAWLLQPENQWCLATIALRKAGIFPPGPAMRADQVHHTRGRIGRLLRLQQFWLPVCQKAHDYIHAHPEIARSIKAGRGGLSLLCAVGEWNTVP